MVDLGKLSTDFCLSCGAGPPNHRQGCIETSDFWGKKDNRSMGRSLRFATVQNVYDGGHITEAQAREILSGPLKPGDDLTVVDDSEWLQGA